MKKGKLKDRITVRRRSQVPDGKGGYATTTDDIGPVWAEVRTLRGDEALNHASLRSVQLYRIELQLRPIAFVTDRIVWHSRLYGDVEMDIKAVGPNDDRSGQVLTAEAGSPS